MVARSVHHKTRGDESAGTPRRKPDWLKVRPAAGAEVVRLKKRLRRLRLHTVCEEARCPNLGECWAEGTATVMILGGICTRGCRFCAVTTGDPGGLLDPEEPARTATAIAEMGVRHVVVTSVDRDDLEDSGAAHFAATIREIRRRAPETVVEVLIGDLRGRGGPAEQIIDAGPHVLAHNLETVRRLTRRVRDARAGYDTSLRLLDTVRNLAPELPTKSSLMLGLGETEEEVTEAMDDLRAAGVRALTLGQYLRPTPRHLPVARFATPEEFRYYEHLGLLKGFRHVSAGPLVRSSYKAGSFHLQSGPDRGGGSTLASEYGAEEGPRDRRRGPEPRSA